MRVSVRWLSNLSLLESNGELSWWSICVQTVVSSTMFEFIELRPSSCFNNTELNPTCAIQEMQNICSESSKVSVGCFSPLIQVLSHISLLKHLEYLWNIEKNCLYFFFHSLEMLAVALTVHAQWCNVTKHILISVLLILAVNITFFFSTTFIRHLLLLITK